MFEEKPSNYSLLVEENRVHKSVYYDPEIFDAEMEHIWGRAWIFIGHDSQVPNKGDFYTTEIGHVPVVMVRGNNEEVHVLHNRCGHKGAKVAGKKCGNVSGFRCPYHGWSYKLDGSLLGVPNAGGYKGTDFDIKDEQFSMTKVANVASVRGFIFASLSKDVPTIEEFLGDSIRTINNVADRAPEGEIEIVGKPFRYEHDSNWKMFIENLNDTMHPMVTHASVGKAARSFLADQPEGTKYPGEAEIIFPFGSSYKFFDDMKVTALNYGHSYVGGESSIHTAYSDIPDYIEAMNAAYGTERTNEVFSQNRHNTIIYPSFTIKDAVQCMRVVRPISVDKTIIETWHFKLKGAPIEMLKRTIMYSRLINSNASMVGPDDWDCYKRMHEGLRSTATEWVDMRRGLGEDTVPVQMGGERSFGTSDLSFRNQYKAWANYLKQGGK
jgi:benzoate/toluate 1,2-dioxygenase subunit alpha